MGNVAQKSEKSIAGAIKINEKEIVDHLSQLVRQSVADTINSFLDAEADAICQAGRYQRNGKLILLFLCVHYFLLSEKNRFS